MPGLGSGRKEVTDRQGQEERRKGRKETVQLCVRLEKQRLWNASACIREERSPCMEQLADEFLSKQQLRVHTSLRVHLDRLSAAVISRRANARSCLCTIHYAESHESQCAIKQTPASEPQSLAAIPMIIACERASFCDHSSRRS